MDTLNSFNVAGTGTSAEFAVSQELTCLPGCTAIGSSKATSNLNQAMAQKEYKQHDSRKKSSQQRPDGAKQQCEQYEFEYSILEQKVCTLTDENMRLKTDLKEKIGSNDSLEEQNAAFNVQVHELRNETSALKDENDSFQLEIGIIRQSEQGLKQKVEALRKEVEKECTKSRALSRKVLTLEVDIEEKKHKVSQLGKELEETKMGQQSASRKNTDLEEDVRNLQKQIKSLASQREEEKDKAERTKKHSDMATIRISELEKEIEEHKRTNDKLKIENQACYQANEKLRVLKGTLEAQNSANEKEVLELKQKVSALQASAEAREKSWTEHMSDCEEREKRHTAEKEQLQSQIDMFLEILNEDKRVERDVINKAVQQLAETSMATNQFLHGAFASFQRRYHQQNYRPSANIRRLPDDS